jgi:ubiquitin C-terminal hydrolase
MSTSFGLRNQRGSCWVNATLQAFFRIPDVQTRYIAEAALDTSPVDKSLQEIWCSKGDEGLKAFYECVRTAVMPAGEGIGDSHELLEFMCDKLQFLDKLCRFKVANTIKCNSCAYKDVRTDSMIEFSVTPTQRKQSLTDCVVHSVTPVVIPDWTCEKCKAKGCTKQLLMSSFPQIFVFHATSLNTSVSYSTQLVMNGQKYALMAVVCFNGGHWWTYGRDMPPGKDWVEHDDSTIRNRGPQHFPLSDHMRLLFYYRLNE